MTQSPTTALREHIAEVTIRKGETPAEILSVTNDRGFVRSLDVFDKQVFSQDASNYKLVRFNDLAYNPSRINVGSVARCELASGGAVSPMYVVVRCRETLSPKFLLYFLKSDIGRQYIARWCVGAVRFMLRFGDLERIELPLPPLSEQERLVGVLDEVDALRRVRVTAAQRMATVARNLFSDLFGDPIRNPKGWPTGTVGERLSMLEYGPRFYSESYSVAGTRIARITDIDEFGNLRFNDMPKMEVDAKTLAARQLQPGDFIFARSGATVGKVALFPQAGPACIAGAYFVRFRFTEDIEPVFGLELLRSDAIQTIIAGQSKQAAQPNFSGPLIKALPLFLPPRKLQQAFDIRIREVRELQSAQAQCEHRLDELLESLLQRAFQGQP